MKTIYNIEDLDKMLETSNLQFISSGVLNVSDPLFITRWNIEEKYFRSSLSYSQLNNEAFEISFLGDNVPMSWSQFGFIQSFDLNENLQAPYHRNKHLELHFVSKGVFNLKVNQSVITLYEGDICLINPNCYHSDIINPSLEELELYIIGINQNSVENFSEVFGEFPLLKTAFKTNYKVSEYIVFRSVNTISQAIKQLEANIKDYNEHNLIKLISEIFSYEYNHIVESETSRKTMLYEELLSYIRHNFKTVILEDLEHHYNYSKDYISKTIKEESGLSFKETVQNVKIEEAKILLLNTDLSIKEIMNEVGYQNETHFYKLFKDSVGSTPNEYRQSK